LASALCSRTLLKPRQIADRNLPSLEDAAQAALDTVLTLHGPLVFATAEGRELMEEADTLRLTREEQASLRVGAQIFAENLYQDTNIIEPQAAKIVADAADVIGEGRHPERGTVFGRSTIKHIAAVLVGAGTLAAFIPSAAPLLGAATAAGVAWVGYESLKKSKRFLSATSALGAEYDHLLDLGETIVTERLRTLAPFRDFIRANEEPLREIASKSRQLHWMLTYIDFILKSYAFEHANDPEQKS
jgi:hypothetical protein